MVMEAAAEYCIVIREGSVQCVVALAVR